MWNVWNVTAGHWALRRDTTEDDARKMAEEENKRGWDKYEARERKTNELDK
jgi:hypothetical protein